MVFKNKKIIVRFFLGVASLLASSQVILAVKSSGGGGASKERASSKVAVSSKLKRILAIRQAIHKGSQEKLTEAGVKLDDKVAARSLVAMHYTPITYSMVQKGVKKEKIQEQLNKMISDVLGSGTGKVFLINVFKSLGYNYLAISSDFMTNYLPGLDSLPTRAELMAAHPGVPYGQIPKRSLI